MCDLAYTLRVEQIRQVALAQMQLAPYVEQGQQVATPDMAAAEFDEWLDARPVQSGRDEDVELMGLLGVR